MTLSLSFGEILSSLTLLLAVCIAMGSILRSLWIKVLENAKNLNEYKLEAAREYASAKQIQQLEQKLLLSEGRMINAISSLTERIDRILSRMEK